MSSPPLLPQGAGNMSHIDDKPFKTGGCGEAGECVCDTDYLGRRHIVQSTDSHPGKCVCHRKAGMVIQGQNKGPPSPGPSFPAVAVSRGLQKRRNKASL